MRAQGARGGQQKDRGSSRMATGVFRGHREQQEGNQRKQGATGGQQKDIGSKRKATGVYREQQEGTRSSRRVTEGQREK